MLIFPAIDLYEGKAVRLYKGDYSQMTVYDNDPVNTVRKFKAADATCVHLVDLEGAKSGTTPNFDTVKRIVDEGGMFSEIGGGVRDMKVIEKYLNVGVNRVILGTAATQDESFVIEAVKSYGERIAVGVDIRDGLVAVKGWTETTGYSGMDFCKKMQSIGVKTVICTDISRDGAMMGTNRELYRELSESLGLNIVASGGVSTLEDIKALADMGLYAAIIGKAYYTGAIDLSEAVRIR